MSTQTKNQTASQSQAKKVTCKICGEKFDNTGYLLQHYQQEHPKKSEDKQSEKELAKEKETTKEVKKNEPSTNANNTSKATNTDNPKEMPGKKEASEAEAEKVGDNTGDNLPVISPGLDPDEEYIYDRTLPADIMPEELKWLKPGHTVGLRVTGRLNEDGSFTVDDDVTYL